jgi:olfactory receptor
MYIIGATFGLVPISMIFISYYKIVSSILRIPSSSGRHKAFSTCVSHLTVVCLFYVTGLVEYLGSTGSHCPRKIL